MSDRRDRDFCEDMVEASCRIAEYCTNMSYDEFVNDCRTQDAVIRNLEIIGEAAKKVSKNYQKHMPELPWKEIAGMRDKLIHDYFGVNIDVVWSVAKNDVPALKKMLQEYSSSQ